MSAYTRNLFKCKQTTITQLFVYFVYVSSYRDVIACLLLFLMSLLYFCLLVDHVNKFIVYVFGAFVYHFHFRNNSMDNRLNHSRRMLCKYGFHLVHYSDYIHTYITGDYNPSVKITTQLHTKSIWCVLILYKSGRKAIH